MLSGLPWAGEAGVGEFHDALYEDSIKWDVILLNTTNH